MAEYCLVIDQGGHGSRAMVFNDAGDEVASGSVPVATRYPQPAFAEQDPEEVMHSVSNCLQGLAGKLSEVDIESIQSAALIVQRSSFLACRKSNLQPLTPIISWQDTRNQLLLDQLKPEYAKIRRITGLRANAHYGASKMRWLLENNEQVRQAANKNDLLFVPLAAYIAASITNNRTVVVDPVIASRTLLCELGSLCWNRQLLNLFEIEASFLPTIVTSDFLIGEVKLADKTVPLKLVGGDQSLMAFASGIHLQQTDAYVNVGTGAFIQTQIESDCSELDANLLCSPAVITTNNKVIMAEGTVNAAASALDWLWEHEGQTLSRNAIKEALANIKLPPVFLNTIAGTGSPHWLAYKKPVFIKDSDGVQLEAKVVAVFESIVFALKDNFILMQKGKPGLKQIIISGGLSHYDVFCQKLADLTGTRVVRPVGHEASARGAAIYLMQSVMSVDVDEQQADLFIANRDQGLEQRYQKYCGLIATA